MEQLLDPVEVRVLGCLIEKEIATPEYYPLSLNALVNACNQKSNRDPMVSYDDATVEDALDRLQQKGLSSRVTGRDMRVPKFGHRCSEVFNFGRREIAVLCVLMLRGPQTVGELRGRTERLYTFDDLESVEATLNRLAEWEPDPLVTRLPRQVGFKEGRYAHLLSGDVEVAEAAPPSAAALPASDRGPGLQDRIAALESEIADLKRQFEDFRRQFQ
jgi:uncharacterized protein YceH (UPF0502 family)